MSRFQVVLNTCSLLVLLTCPLCRIFAQATNGSLLVQVLSDDGKPLAGATLKLVHQPTQSAYDRLVQSDGYVFFSQIRVGGPYSLYASYVGYQGKTVDGIEVLLSGQTNQGQINHVPLMVQLTPQQKLMDTVRVKSFAGLSPSWGIENHIRKDLLTNLPSINRGLQEFIRLVPQSRVTGDGVISLAGQNNRFNAFFIDGASSSDILGLAVNGMNGGQSGAIPISIEAMEEISVLLSPYDVQYGRFTGGSIQAVTKSGTNQPKASAWYFFRNAYLTGRSPEPLQDPANPGKYYRPRLPDFFNQTLGTWASGPVIRDKLFFFALWEKQSERRPVVFDPATYTGNSSGAGLRALEDTLRRKYNYEPGSVSEFPDNLETDRFMIKMDWNLSQRHKLMASYRYNFSRRTFSRFNSNSNNLSFSNLAFTLPSVSHTAVLEWNFFPGKKWNNRFLWSINTQQDQRNYIGQPFPRVNIEDGARSTIRFGSEASASFNKFDATEMYLSDLVHVQLGKHALKFGFDFKSSWLDDIIFGSYFGQYTYPDLQSFLNGEPGRLYSRSYPATGNTSPGTRFRHISASAFMGDEIQVNNQLRLTAGIRADLNAWPDPVPTDAFFNDSALPKISTYYDLQGAKSGQKLEPGVIFSPRLGFQWTLPKAGINISGGTGIFTGYVVNIWPSNIYQSGTQSLEINPQLYNLPFIADPLNQPTLESLGIGSEGNRGTLNLVIPRFRFPTVWRSSLELDKNLSNHWKISLQGLYSLNVHETRFTNVNLLPPSNTSAAPGARTIYALPGKSAVIPLLSDSSNPYTRIILMENNREKAGRAFSTSMVLSRQTRHQQVLASYTFARSMLYHEIAAGTTPIESQWSSVENVNGRNNIGLSASDNETRHRWMVMFSQRFNQKRGKTSTQLSLVYEGLSGKPYSFIIRRNMVNEDANQQSQNSLAYIPTSIELEQMNFVSYTIGGITYTPQQQKQMLEKYIQGNRYLSRNRGSFAERNGARTPVTHMLDLRVQQDFILATKNAKLRMSAILDIFNALNLLSYKWGKQYTVPNDNYFLYEFRGFVPGSNLVPRYQFFPTDDNPYIIQPSTVPGNSARWSAQLGFRVYIN